MQYQEYIKTINQLLKRIDESDTRFLKQLCTIINRHIEKKGGD